MLVPCVEPEDYEVPREWHDAIPGHTDANGDVQDALAVVRDTREIAPPVCSPRRRTITMSFVKSIEGC